MDSSFLSLLLAWGGFITVVMIYFRTVGFWGKKDKDNTNEKD